MNEIIVPLPGADPTTAIVIGLIMVVVALLIIIARRTAPLPAVTTSSQLFSIENRLSALESKANMTEQSMHTLERAIAGLPTQRSVHELEKKVIELSGDMKMVAQESRATSAGVGRIEEFLFKASADALFPARNTDGPHSR